jgi:hypothetical protein
VADVDVEGSAEVVRALLLLLLLRARGENEDIDGEIERWRAAEGGSDCSAAARSSQRLGMREDEGKYAMSGVYCGELNGSGRDVAGSSDDGCGNCVLRSFLAGRWCWKCWFVVRAYRTVCLVCVLGNRNAASLMKKRRASTVSVN